MIIAFQSVSFGEYRVYQYFVKSRFNTPYDKNSYLVTDTMDPVTYLAYHGGGESIQIDLLRTWMCVGDTSELRELCPSPLESAIPVTKE